MSNSLIERYQTVQQRIQAACLQANRSENAVSLLAVSKTKPIEDIIQLAELGQSCFGENYVQESLLKIERCPTLEWHFIGPIQSNKTKAIAEHFQWVHSIDRLKIAQRLSQQRPEGMKPLNILLEVNISEEASKAGFSPDELLDIAPTIARLPNLRLRGLMAIPQKLDKNTPFEARRAPFAKVRQLLEQLNQTHGWSLETLSMGMSADLEAAIMEGATMVRIGTDIFGKR